MDDLSRSSTVISRLCWRAACATPTIPWQPRAFFPLRAALRAKARVEALQAELAKVEASAAGYRANFERERERADRLMAELLRATAGIMAAKEAAARLEGEVAALRSRPWWRRLAGCRRERVGSQP